MESGNNQDTHSLDSLDAKTKRPILLQCTRSFVLLAKLASVLDRCSNVSFVGHSQNNATFEKRILSFFVKSLAAAVHRSDNSALHTPSFPHLIPPYFNDLPNIMIAVLW